MVLAAVSALVFLCAVAFRQNIYTVQSLLRANWNTDLRDEFIWYRHIIHHTDPAEFSGSTSIVRSDGGYNLWRSRIGDFWMTKDDDVAVLLELAEIIEGNTYKYRGRSVRPGDVVIDCGAHLGSFVRKSLQLGASLVVAIEPSSQKIECMRRTFADEIAAGKVRLLRVAVWDKTDKLWLAGSPTLTNSLVRPPGRTQPQTGEWANVTTLDSLVAAEHLDRVDFVKMDIEGAEVGALVGAKGTIQRLRPFLAVAVEHTDDLAQNARNVLHTVDGFHLGYRHGFGRYGKLRKWAAYTPWEIFFFTDDADRRGAR